MNSDENTPRSKKLGRLPLDAEMRQLIRRMCRENPAWGAPRIQSELALLGHDVAESTVAKYMLRGRTPPSQTWRTFLGDHYVRVAVGVCQGRSMWLLRERLTSRRGRT